MFVVGGLVRQSMHTQDDTREYKHLQDLLANCSTEQNKGVVISTYVFE